MKYSTFLFILLIASSALALWGQSRNYRDFDFQNFMKNSNYEVYGCTTVTDGTLVKAEKPKLYEFSEQLVMAQNLDEAKAHFFNRLHTQIRKKDQTYILHFSGSGATLKDVVCHQIKDLIKD